MNNLIKDRIKEIIYLQNSIKLNDLDYSPTKVNHNFSNYSLRTVLLIDMHQGNIKQKQFRRIIKIKIPHKNEILK